jgi:nitroimidazol reductase NimA-like FMN-containing flavoprotein (pyridoxamine 5'-phosphate oxidase superfamily)
MALTPEQRRANTLEFLKDACVMNLATTDGNVPLASIMLYAVDDAFHFYFVSFRSAKKVAHIAKNPRVSISVWGHNTALVEVEGNAFPMPSQRKAGQSRAHACRDSHTRISFLASYFSY